MNDFEFMVLWIKPYIDCTKGGHYQDFIGFLTDSKMYPVNGRIGSKLTNLILYISQNDIKNCVKFIVHPVIISLKDLKLQTDKILDHSVLELCPSHILLPVISNYLPALN